MKFLCKLFGCESKTVIKEVIKEVPVEVIKEVPVEAVKEVQADSKSIYPQKPERPDVSGSLKEQLIQIYDHYGYERLSDASLDILVSEIDDNYIDLFIDLIDTINNNTMEYMNRPAFSDEVTAILITYKTDRATHNEQLEQKIKLQKEKSRVSYIHDAIRLDLPVCGCQVHNQ